MRPRGVRAVKRNDVGGCHQFIEWNVTEVQHLRQQGFVPRIERQHPHTEAFGYFDGVQPNASRADHSQRLARKVKTTEVAKGNLLGQGVHKRFMNIPRERKNQGEGVLGDGVLAVGGHVGNRNGPLAAICQVDVIVSGGACGDELQVGELLQNLAIQRRVDEYRNDIRILRLFKRPLRQWFGGKVQGVALKPAIAQDGLFPVFQFKKCDFHLSPERLSTLSVAQVAGQLFNSSISHHPPERTGLGFVLTPYV